MFGLTKPISNEGTLQSRPAPIPVNIIEFMIIDLNNIQYNNIYNIIYNIVSIIYKSNNGCRYYPFSHH